MRNYKEISKEDVVKELKEGTEVVAVVLNCTDRVIRGGDYIKSGVYPLNNRMSIADIARYEKEDNVAFYANLKDESVATSQQKGEA